MKWMQVVLLVSCFLYVNSFWGRRRPAAPPPPPPEPRPEPLHLPSYCVCDDCQDDEGNNGEGGGSSVDWSFGWHQRWKRHGWLWNWQEKTCICEDEVQSPACRLERGEEDVELSSCPEGKECTAGPLAVNISGDALSVWFCNNQSDVNRDILGFANDEVEQGGGREVDGGDGTVEEGEDRDEGADEGVDGPDREEGADDAVESPVDLALIAISEACFIERSDGSREILRRRNCMEGNDHRCDTDSPVAVTTADSVGINAYFCDNGSKTWLEKLSLKECFNWERTECNRGHRWAGRIRVRGRIRGEGRIQGEGRIRGAGGIWGAFHRP